MIGSRGNATRLPRAWQDSRLRRKNSGARAMNISSVRSKMRGIPKDRAARSNARHFGRKAAATTLVLKQSPDGCPGFVFPVLFLPVVPIAVPPVRPAIVRISWPVISWAIIGGPAIGSVSSDSCSGNRATHREQKVCLKISAVGSDRAASLLTSANHQEAKREKERLHASRSFAILSSVLTTDRPTCRDASTRQSRDRSRSPDRRSDNAVRSTPDHRPCSHQRPLRPAVDRT
jgi:hypothetical protein